MDQNQAPDPATHPDTFVGIRNLANLGTLFSQRVQAPSEDTPPSTILVRILTALNVLPLFTKQQVAELIVAPALTKEKQPRSLKLADRILKKLCAQGRLTSRKVDATDFVGAKDSLIMFPAFIWRPGGERPHMVQLRGQLFDRWQLSRPEIPFTPGYSPIIYGLPDVVAELGDLRHMEDHLGVLIHLAQLYLFLHQPLGATWGPIRHKHVGSPWDKVPGVVLTEQGGERRAFSCGFRDPEWLESFYRQHCEPGGLTFEIY